MKNVRFVRIVPNGKIHIVNSENENYFCCGVKATGPTRKEEVVGIYNGKEEICERCRVLSPNSVK